MNDKFKIKGWRSHSGEYFLGIVPSSLVSSWHRLLFVIVVLLLFVRPSAAAPTANSVESVSAALGTLSVNIIEDTNVNMIWDVTELVRISGVTVNLYDATSAAPCASTTTTTAGQAIFNPADTASCVGDSLRMEVDTNTFPAGYEVGPINMVDDDGNASTSVFNDSVFDFSPAVQIVDLSSDVDLNVSAVNPTTYTCNVSNAFGLTTCFVQGDPMAADATDILKNSDTIVGFPYTASGSAFPVTLGSTQWTVASGDVVEPEHWATAEETGAIWGLAWSQQYEVLYSGAFVKRHIGLGPLGVDGIYATDLSTGVPATTSWLQLGNLGIDVGQSIMPTPTVRAIPGDFSSSHDAAVYPHILELGIGDIDLVADEALDTGIPNGWVDEELMLVVNLYEKKVHAINTQTQAEVAVYDIPDPGTLAGQSGCVDGEHRPFAVEYQDGKMYVGLICDGSQLPDADKDDYANPHPELEAIIYEYDLLTTPTPAPTVPLRFNLDYEKGKGWTGGCGTQSYWMPWRDTTPLEINRTNRYCWPTPIITDIEFTEDGDLIIAFGDRTVQQWGWFNFGLDESSTENHWADTSGDILMACPDATGTLVLESNATCGGRTAAGGVNNNQGPGGGEFFWGEQWGSHQETAGSGVAVLPGTNQIMAAGMDPYNNLVHSAAGINWYDLDDGQPRAPGYMLFASIGSNANDASETPGTQGKAGGLGDVDVMCPQIPVNIGDFVWFDADGDGIQDPDEQPLAGVTVYLELPNGSLIQTTTDENGYYVFGASRNQSYDIAFDPSTTTTTVNVDGIPVNVNSFISTEDNEGSDSHDSDINDNFMTVNGKSLAGLTVQTTINGASDHTNDAGFVVPMATLGDLVFHDKDNDGVYNGGSDTLLVGTVLTLTSQSGATVTTTVQSDGRYEFLVPVGDTYTITVDTSALPMTKSPIPTGSSSNTADDTSEGVTSFTVTVPEDGDGFEDLTLDFGFGTLGSLGNTIFHDADGDGAYDPSGGDYPLSGVTVTLLDENGGTQTITTDGNGYYEFGDLPLNATYTVTLETDDLPNDKNPDATSGIGADQVSSGTITLTTQLTADNRQDPTLDFGFEPFGQIGNRVFHDVDGDGVFEPASGEFPLAGVELILTYPNGMTRTTVTDGSGNYLFDNLPLDATYTVTVNPDTVPTNKISTPTNGSANPLLDVSSGTGTLTAELTHDDPVDVTLDFGYQPVVAGIEIVKLAGTAPDTEVYTITVPSVVTYAYKIKNAGATHLIDTVVTDDLGTGSSADDITISTDPTAGSNTYCAALDAAEPLAPGESVTCYIALFIDRDVTNIATVVADPAEPDGEKIPNLEPPTDDDPAEVVYDRPVPAIKIVKTAGTAADGQTYVINELGMVTFYYTVTNIGETYLQDVTIVDDASTPSDTSDDVTVSCAGLANPIAPGDSVSCSAQIMVNGNHLNVATTEGTPADSDGNEIEELENPTDNDPADVEYAPDGSIGNLIFHDADRDGVFEPEDGDFPLEDVLVTLTASDGSTQTLLTDETGNYLFTGLPFDTYTVEVDTDTLPMNKSQAPPSYEPEGDGNSSTTVTIDPDNPSDIDQDFGYEPLGTLGSTVFHDVDGNGAYEPSEGDFPLGGVVISLTTPTGVITTTTNGDGQYQFVDLPFDVTYTVEVDTTTVPETKNGGVATGSSALDADETSEGTNVLTTTLTTDNPDDPTLDFGYEPLGVIGDTIFHDANNDGVFDPLDGDYPLPSVDVILTDVATGITTTDTTDALGQYLFSGLPFGDYTVEVVTSTLPDDKITNPTADPENDGNNISAVTLTPELPSNLDQDFGYQPEGTLGNTIFHDADGDGVYEPNDDDFPLVGVEVVLTYPNGTIETTTTDGNGFYEFTDLLLDETYSVTVNPDSLPESKNSDPTGDSNNDADQTSEGTMTLTTTLTSGTDGRPTDATLDFGFEPLGSVGSTIFHDEDGDGIYEPNDGDLPLDGVTVELTYPDGTTETAVTDINGQYSFDGLPLGETYTVAVDTDTLPQSKWEGATGVMGNTADETSQGTDSLSTTLTVDLVDDVTLDFGFQPKGQIGDFLFHDADGDGVYEPNGGDFPLEGVVIELENSNGDIVTATTDINGVYLFSELPFDEYTVTVDTDTLPDTKSPNPTSSPDGDNSSTITLSPSNPSDLDQDFSYQPLGTLGNTIFHDIDADGVYDTGAGDVPLDGVIVILTYPNGVTETETTDGNGFYEFTDLPLNETYTITVDTSSLPVSKNPDATGVMTNTADQTSQGTITLTTTLTDEEPNDPTLDVGFAPFGTIGDTIFHDVDGDGMYEPNLGEFPLDGVEVILTDGNGVTQTATTDVNGNYLFDGLPFGDYTVEVNPDTLPATKAPIPTADPENDQNNISNVTLTPADPENLDQDFGYQPLGALGSTVFHDINNDGIYDPTAGDFPLSDVLVTLTKPNGDVITTTTDGNGFYQFTELALEATYTVEVDTTTLPETKDENATGDSGNDTDETSEGVSVLTATLTADSPNDPTLDFGYQPLGTVGTTIFHDTDADGVYEPSLGEFPIEGVVVTLEGSDGTVLTTTTDALGNYQFTGLPLDVTYTVTVDPTTLPESKAPAATGTADLADDQTSEGVLTLTTTLTTDMPSDPTLDFGFQSKGVIGDFIFHDLDGDGNFEPNDGEFPLQGVEIVLTDENGNTQTTTTDPNGFYDFTDLPFGTYSVTVNTSTLPDGKSVVPSADPEGDNNSTSTVTITADEPQNLDQDFGYQPLGAIGSLLFHDVDADGVYEPNSGEFPLEGVQLILTDANGMTQTTTTDETGFYQFTDLPLDETYTVSVDTTTLPDTKSPDPTGNGLLTADQTSEGVLMLETTLTPSSPNDQTLDFGFQANGEIGDFIFHDLDGDGVYEPENGEFPLVGVNVILTDENGDVQTATTDPLGNYLFTNLPLDATYTIEVDETTLPSSKEVVPTADPENDGDNESTVTLTAANPNDYDQDFGYQPSGALGSTVFHDVNFDGVYDPAAGDFPLGDVLVTLTDESGNTQTMTTDANGFYQFTELPLGVAYTVTVETNSLPDNKDPQATGDSLLTDDQTSEGVSTLTTVLTADSPNDQTLDFGYQPLGTLGTTVFHDLDGDGVYEPNEGEFPLENVTVTLVDENGNTDTTTTDALGNYAFTGLPLDTTYTVTVDANTLPSSKFVDATGDDSLTDDQTSEGVLSLTTTLTSGDDGMPSDPTLDFGFQPAGTIGDFIFHDLDGDGVYEPNDGEFPLQGVVVTLEDEDGNVQTAVTDELGQYLFNELPLNATYIVTVDETTLPDGKSTVPSADPEDDGNNTSTITLTPDMPDDLDQDFGYQPLGALGSLVFHDADGDGVFEPQDGDFPLDDVTVTLTDENGNTQMMMTDENGFYQFTGLPLNAPYTVSIDTASLPTRKSPDATGDDTLTDDQTSEGVVELETVLTAAQPNDQTLDFGFQPKGEIGDFIFHDVDGDGIFEPNSGEFPLEGVEVIITDSNGVTQTTTTDQNGMYLFLELPFDTYTVEVNTDTLPINKATTPTSDPEGDGDNVSEVTLTADSPVNYDQDFSYQPLGALGSTVFHDVDNNGVYDPTAGDFPLADVVITLTDENGDTQTTTTDGNGFYQFTDLMLGVAYTVSVETATLPDTKDTNATGDSSLTDDETSEGVSVLTTVLTDDMPNDPTLDFGYRPLGTIGTTVFHDMDGDGVYEPSEGEFPLEGVRVTLIDEDGNEQSILTDEFGNYAFTDLPLNKTYTVTLDASTLPDSKSDMPTGDESLTADQTSEGTLALVTTLTPDQPSDSKLDFGFQPAGQIGDFIFHDLNGDGVYEPLDGEFVLPGVEVTLTDGNGDEQTTTDENGNYLFTELEFGDYTVTVNPDTLPDGKSDVPSADPENDGNNTSNVTLTAEMPSDLGQDFGYQPLGGLGSLVFHDEDGDGIYEPQEGDFPLADVTVTLTDEAGNTQTQMTDQNGFYQFSDLPLDATYTVSIDTSSLPSSKSPDATGDSSLTVDQTSEGVIELETTLTAAQPNDQTLDFGFQPKGVIGDFIFHDLDGDGLYEPLDGEFVLPDVTVVLTDENGNMTTTMTDENGNYLFTDLEFGEYDVMVNTDTLPGGKSPVPSADPENDGNSTSTVMLTPDDPADLDQDFGYQPLGALGSLVFHDADGDGVYEPQDGDFPLADVTVTLTDESGETQTRLTDQNGFYQFTGLPLDATYTVAIETGSLPDSKSPAATGSSALVADQTSEGVITLETTLTADTPNDQTLDFGFQPKGVIGDFIFHDADGDGMYEPNSGEFPLQGVEVILTNGNGDTQTTTTDELGQYLFTDLPFGDYTVEVNTDTLPENKATVPTSDPENDGDNVSSVTLTADNPSDRTQDFSYQPKGTLGNTIFHDVDADGVYEPADGEFPLENVVVTLTLPDGTTRETMTDENGFYQFTELPLDATYSVTVDVSSLPATKAPLPTGDESLTADQTSEGTVTLMTTLTADRPSDPTLDFGFQRNGLIGDFLFHDADGDGVFEPNDGESPLEGVEVTLTDENANVITTTTDINGHYLFTDVPFGDYVVTVNTDTLPDGKSPDPTTDPDGDGGNSAIVTLTPDEPNDLDQDFGYRPLGELGTFLFHDTDGDGRYDPILGEYPLTGIRVTLSDETGVIDEMMTDDLGQYLFTDLPLGKQYTVTVDISTLPESKEPVATMGRGVDDDSNGANTLTTTLTGQNPADYTLDFGYQPRGMIGNFLFQDIDGDGRYEPQDGEYPLVGVTVMLTDENLQIQSTVTDRFGFYQFIDLPYGTYAVSVDTSTLPEGKVDESSDGVDSVGGNTAATELTAENPSDNTLNFGYEPIGFISNRAFHDVDGDGMYIPENGDFPLEGVEVILTLDDGTTMTATTDIDGMYYFSNMPFGEYMLEYNTATLPADKIPEATNGIQLFNIDLDDDNPVQTGLDFGFQSTGMIGDIIFHDADGDGVFDPDNGDIALSNVRVTLTTADGTTETTTTDDNGQYLFGSLLPGDYTITVDPTTLPSDKNLDEVDTTATTTLTPATPSDLTLDFGYAPNLGQIDGIIFHDNDRDGFFNPNSGDFLLSDVIVTAQLETGVLFTTTTDANGIYTFPDLPLDLLYTISVDTVSLPSDKFPSATGDGDTDSVGNTSTILFLADNDSDPNVDNFDQNATIPFGFAEAKPTGVKMSQYTTTAATSWSVALLLLTLTTFVGTSAAKRGG